MKDLKEREIDKALRAICLTKNMKVSDCLTPWKSYIIPEAFKGRPVNHILESFRKAQRMLSNRTQGVLKKNLLVREVVKGNAWGDMVTEVTSTLFVGNFFSLHFDTWEFRAKIQDELVKKKTSSNLSRQKSGATPP